eukprot:SAG11_NODE_1862_length_4154_cov_7.221208_2_plen_288_part_00
MAGHSSSGLSGAHSLGTSSLRRAGGAFPVVDPGHGGVRGGAGRRGLEEDADGEGDGEEADYTGMEALEILEVVQNPAYRTSDRLHGIGLIDFAAIDVVTRSDLVLLQRELLQQQQDEWEESELRRMHAGVGRHVEAYPNAQPTSMYESATYTYHAGTFDVHGQDVVYTNESLIDYDVFYFGDNMTFSKQLEGNFWEVLDDWDTVATSRWAKPVLGVGRTRVLHTVAATRRASPGWMEGLPDEELEDYARLGIKQVRNGLCTWRPPVTILSPGAAQTPARPVLANSGQ